VPAQNDHGQPVGDPVPGWTARPHPDLVRLEGRYVAVVPLAPEHAPALYDAVCGPEDGALWTYRGEHRPESVEETTALVAEHLARPDLVTFALVPHGQAVRGIASYMRIDHAHGSIEVGGVLFARSLQRTREATEAIHLLMRHAFDELGYRRFEWKCDALNEPSRRAASRFGFTYEGRFRGHLVVKGRSRDTDWFSVTDAEWPAVRAAHEAWLDPSNFDADGQQLSRLRVAR
jgi:RimJ/RimL family protein N-acetyltransferase